jgi:hypothetical protein
LSCPNQNQQSQSIAICSMVGSNCSSLMLQHYGRLPPIYPPLLFNQLDERVGFSNVYCS